TLSCQAPAGHPPAPRSTGRRTPWRRELRRDRAWPPGAGSIGDFHHLVDHRLRCLPGEETRGLGRRLQRFPGLLLAEGDLLRAEIDVDGIPGGELPLEDLHGKRVFDLFLEQPAQRPCAELLVESLVDEVLAGLLLHA